MKKFVPTNLDLTDFDSERLSKQCDLETVRITLSRDAAKEEEYEIKPFYVRQVERETNEEGMFRRLQMELLQIA